MKKKSILFIFPLLVLFALTSCAKDGQTPYIGKNGNWWIGDTDTNVSAQGPKGDKGDQGEKGDTGNKGAKGDKGDTGEKGDKGKSVTVSSVKKTNSQGLVDTYTITFSDESTAMFTVTNGESNVITNVQKTGSQGLVDTYTITFTNGSTKTFTVTNGATGDNLTISSIELKNSQGLIDTYVINYSDNSKFEFVVSNGEAGLTPYIGDNGNWWIGETDTNVLADYDKANNVPLTVVSSGLAYDTITIDGKSGFVVTGWNYNNSDFFSPYFKAKYGENVNINDVYKELEEHDVPLVIPNYVGSVPVIGVAGNAKLNFKNVVLSSNTIYLGNKAFYNCDHLQSIDFNNSKITYIPSYCFAGTNLNSINFPETVTHVFDHAFDDVVISNFNLSNLKYIGNYAFNDAFTDHVYLPKTVEYVGDHAFDRSFVYLETESKPSTWGSISDFSVIYNVRNNGEYLYSVENNEATIYQYLGDAEKLIIPAKVDNFPITTIGTGFNSFIFDERMDDGTNKETYQNFKNVTGYIKELVIGNNVKKIDKYSLLNGNMFIYIEKCVEEIWVSNSDDLIGCFASAGLDTRVPFSLVVIEDSSKTKFKVENSSELKTYDELLTTVDDDLEILFITNIKYDNIYFDEENEIYYVKDGLSYSVLACKNNYIDNITIMNAINGLPVKIIEKYAFPCVVAGKIKIGNNVNKIKTYGFIDCATRIFIPSNVSIINAYGIGVESGYIIYVEASQKPDDWDSNWNNNNRTVVYSTTKETFDSMIIYGDFIGVLKSNNTIELTQYLGTINNGTTIKIPRTIDGKTVSAISSNFIKTTSNLTNLKIYIPNTIQIIGQNAFALYQYYSSYAYIYLEATAIPTTFETNWYYNSYSGDNSYINCLTGQEFDY